ncbi:MAG: oxygenase MpaB family protein [Usitatibacteraceae bacterium]
MPSDTSAAKADLNARLDQMQFRADPLADATIAAILGPWGQPTATATPKLTDAGDRTTYLAAWQPQWEKLAAVSKTFAQWTDNAAIKDWQATAELPPEISGALTGYLQAGSVLPTWADHGKLERAEALFMEYGALSVTMLFCSSLPECYVIPDLAAVLHATAQLETHTDYRIRATGAMIFPVMMAGGLTAPDGGGVAQILKVRLIHATVRNLVLRGTPESALAAVPPGERGRAESAKCTAGVVPPVPGAAATGNMHQTLFAHGWKTGAEGLPCNQEELAYTLLTFSYVFLRSMRKLGLPLTRADEEAYLHSWNVAGHVLGIERELMADTMDAAETMFDRMQARGRTDWRERPAATDPRPSLGGALMQSMQAAIPLPVAKPFPVLLTRYLCGHASSRDLSLVGPQPWLSRLLFMSLLLGARTFDTVLRLVFPDFSIARFLTRVLGYHLICKLLMDQTRPLKLPEHVRDQVSAIVGHWSADAKAPGWMNSLEDSLTTEGSWNAMR